MGIEIERKFLVSGSAWRDGAKGVMYRQGYLSANKERVVRVRRAGDQGFLTIKGAPTGIARAEFEYPIPVEEADAMLDTLCLKPLIEKQRYQVRYGAHRWEIDEFFGENQGLIVAEIELAEVGETFAMPPWVTTEVTDDARYANANLIAHPFCTWQA